MASSDNNLVKILFKFYSDVLEQETVETLWAETVDVEMGYFRIDSIPFYVPMVATDDIVLAEYDHSHHMLVYKETVMPSGNSIVWVVIVDEETDIDEIRAVFYSLGCDSESLSDRYYSMEVKATTNYLRIKDKLNELRAEGLIDYAEPYLSAEHQY
jgi:hypothetical protein